MTAKRAPSVLDDLPLHFPRVFYAFLGLVERRLAETGLDKRLRPGMGHVMFALLEEDDCILKDLGRRTRLAHNTLSGLLRRMEEAGLVKCRSCQDDARARRVQLTRLGRSLEPALREFHRDIVATVQGRLSDAEAATLRELLGRVTESMREAEPAERTRTAGAAKQPARRR